MESEPTVDELLAKLTPEHREMVEQAVAKIVPHVVDELVRCFKSDFDKAIARSERMIREGKYE